MGLYNKLPEDINDVDVIVVGGGAAGCIVAGRLAEADPSLSILLVESGPDNYGDPTVVTPAFWLAHMDPNDKFILPYKSTPSNHLAGREAIIPTSRVLGGGSSVNMLLYSRPQRSELDAWKTPGWSADEVLAYMNKFESYHGPGPKDRHGYDGPIYVGPGQHRSHKLESQFIEAVRQFNWPELDDINDLDSSNGCMRALRYVNPQGSREDVAHGYLHPKLRSSGYPNLHVLVETDVERVLFDGDRASGVVLRPCPAFQPDTEQKARTVSARRQIVISAGAMGTPPILERSGIGNPDVLRRAGVPLVSAAPGVGENYLDHHIMLYPYKTSLEPEDTLDSLLSGRLNVGELLERKDPILSSNSVDVQCKLRPDDTDIAQMGPEFQAAWDKNFRDSPDKPMMVISLVACYPGDGTSVPAGQYMGIATFSVHPFSRGRLHISGPNIAEQPVLEAGFWEDTNEIDLKQHVWMYKKQREMVRRMDCFAGEVATGHPEFPSGSRAAAVESTIPNIQDVEYTADDDKAIEDWLRAHVASCWHSMGTCKMASQDEGGVVDPSLNVYGVRGLKLADLSIAPNNVGANTCGVAMAIGEKAADLIIQELDLTQDEE